MPDYKILEVQTRRDLMRFVRFPDELYKDCPQYVPALHGDQVKSLTRVAPLDYCKHAMWLVQDGDRVVGRICAMVNPRYNERYGRRRARFGWFDCIKDIEVARLLLATAEGWAREQGMDEIHGPLYYNTFGKQGMLCEGYDNIPPFNCLYNYPYYNDFVQELGYVKECDWIQYKMVANHGVPDKARRVSKLVKERYNLHFGSIARLKKDKALVRKFFQVYNESFATSVVNFIPLTDKEIDEEAASVMPFLTDKASSLLLDENDEIVAFGISFPSISKALQKAKGRLFPFGWWHLLRALRDYETTDLMVNGAAPEWQNKGVSAVYYEEMADKARRIGNRWAISNPQIESNSAVNIWNSYEHEPFMRRRCYIKKI
jgi:GNAT superfamily N-acetyltransferase